MHGINYSVSLGDCLPPVAMATKFRYMLPKWQIVVKMSNFSGELGSHYIKQQ